MLRRDAGQSISFCDGFRKRYILHMGRGFLPLLAVILLAAPQLAFAQGSLAVTVDPRSLNIDEGQSGTYTVVLDTQPATGTTVTVMVVGAGGAVTVGNDELEFNDQTWNGEQTVTVTATEDMNAVDEVVTLTHTATIIDAEDNEEKVTLSNVSVTVRVDDAQTQGVTVSALDPAEVPEAGSATYMISLNT